MPDLNHDLAEHKLILLFLLYQMNMPLTISQIVDFSAEGDYMDYFSCQQYIAQMLDSNLIYAETAENNTTLYSITEDGEQVLSLFSKMIPYSRRAAIYDYVSENKKRIKREFEVVANYFHNGGDEYLVKCGIYEDENALMEISLSVTSKEQAKRIKHNWKNNVTELYGKILMAMIDEESGLNLKDELEQNFVQNHVTNSPEDDDNTEQRLQ